MKLKSLLIVSMLMWSAVGYAEENILNVPDKQVNVDRIFYNADMLVQEKSATGKEYQPNCIPEDIAIKAWGVILDIYKESINIGGTQAEYANCDPCKCPTNGMEACYRFMAEREKLKVEAYQISSELLGLAKRYGICK